MSDRNYWTQYRLGRRKVLAGGSALALGAAAAAMAGCGGSDDPEQPKGIAARGLLSALEDTSSRAKVGGTLQANSTETISLDSVVGSASATAAAANAFLYSRLVKFKTGVLEGSSGEIVGDLAESWEISGDKMQITFKLRPDAKFDARAPTNGRTVEAKDVLFSADRMKSLSTFSNSVFKINNSLGPIDSFSSPDPRTVVAKLASPSVLAMQVLANPRYFYIFPQEAGSGFDLKVHARGSGPWTLKSFRASQGIDYQRNPNWHGAKGLPYLDTVSYTFLTEYATQLSQFRAGNLGLGGAIRTEDLLALKKERPDLLVTEGDFPRAGMRLVFGHEETKFKDERARQAASMALDRELLIDVFESTEVLRREGLPISTRWHTCLPCGWDGAWLDPRESSFGPNAQFYKYDIAEAKKLLAAAGHPNGFEFNFYSAHNNRAANYYKLADLLPGVWAEVGLKANRVLQDYQTEYQPQGELKTKFPGVRLNASSAQGDPVEMLTGYYHSKGSFGEGQLPFEPEPDVDATMDALAREFDDQKRLTMIHDFQRLMAKRMRLILDMGGAPGLGAAWPWVGNYGVYRTFNGTAAGAESLPHYWYDESKRS